LAAAQPTTIFDAVAGIDRTSSTALQWGVTVVGTAADFNGLVDQPFGALALYNTLASFGGSSSGNLLSGNQNVGLSVIAGAGSGTPASAIDKTAMINLIKDDTQVFPLSLNGKGARICLVSASAFVSGRKYAKMTIGGVGKQLTTKLEFDQQVNCPGL
jgi:hypothetical protein